MKTLWTMIFCLLCSMPAWAYQGRLVEGTWQQSWNDALKKSLNSSGLLDHKEKQIDTLCPSYGSDSGKRMNFWLQLFVSLAWKESMHGPTNYVNFNGGVNKGLYQIDPRLLGAYQCGSIDLYNPIANIQCAVKMAVRLVQKDGSFLLGAKGGMAAYWQPLRATSSTNKQNRGFILSQTSAACKTGKIAYDSTTKNLIELQADGELNIAANTPDDLGLDPQQLRAMDASSVEQAPTFEWDPASGLTTSLTP